MHAGTFSLSGFSCSHARSHPVRLSRRSRRHRSTQHQNQVKLFGQHDRTLRPVQAHPTSLGRSVTTAAYNVQMSTSQSAMDLARLNAVVTPHAGDWLHAPPLTAVGLQLPYEAIRVAIGHRLGTNMSTSHMRMWRNSRRLRSAWIGLPPRVHPVTSVTHSSMT